MCSLNGRFDSSLDDYTSVSGRGRAVVDYIHPFQDEVEQSWIIYVCHTI